MPHKKIIFLDIDGVVLPERANFLPSQTKPVMKVFDPCAVSLLNNACHKRRFKLVIHSSWLRYYQNETLPHCISQGIKKGHFHDDACCDGNLHWRYDRVDEWLSRHPEVTKYFILDDTPPDDGYPRRDHWIPINPDEGITLEVWRMLTTGPLK